MKILITGPALVPEATAILEQHNATIFTSTPYCPTQELQNTAEREQVDALIVRMGTITKDVISASRKLRVITKHGVGVNTIDVAAATALGIPVMITPAANALAVAEHAVALILSLLRDVPNLDRGIRQGLWPKATTKGSELSGKQVGIVGFGNIGRALLALLKPFKVNMLIYDPYISLPEHTDCLSARQVDRLETLLAEVDILSLHCPLTTETENMIGRDELRLMKPTAYLINTARGGIVDEAALTEALQNHTIGGAGLDTFSSEPPAKDHPLWLLPNVVFTPHIGGQTKESFQRMGMRAAQNIIGVLTQNHIDTDCIVNPEVLNPAKKI
ncbi:MAG: hydroxyacid dehydrogenase [Thermodesulfobacteriota bacterium]